MLYCNALAFFSALYYNGFVKYLNLAGDFMKIKEDFILRKVADSYVVVPVNNMSLDFNGIINLNETGAVQFNKNFAQFGVMVGYTYHFKTSNGTRHFKTYDVGAMAAEIGHLNEELAKKPKEVEVIKYVDRNNAPATNAFGNATGFCVTETVYFAFNSTELDARAKEALDKLGQNGVYVIDAYASCEGSTAYNLKLSQRRADAVKAYLESRGAKVDSATGHGVQFGTTTGRVAVVKLK